MKGLELSRRYYEAYGKPMLTSRFPQLLPLLAVGFVGSGSERFGFDDEISQDHDFEPGFCLFLPGESVVDRRSAFQLERAYAQLPKDFLGYSRQPLSPVGGNRNGVIRTADFYRQAVGAADGVLTIEEWLRIPESALAEATNGEVFYDGPGEFTFIRNSLQHMPRDIRLKRLAGALLWMAQTGQYNYLRCLSHQEPESAQLACHEFVQAAMKAFFLLHERYMPYYKWSFRALRALEGGEPLSAALTVLLGGDLYTEQDAVDKYDAIEAVSSIIIALLHEQGLTRAVCTDLQKHAYSVNDSISDGMLRSLHILSTV